jgi:hypothetical protein
MDIDLDHWFNKYQPIKTMNCQEINDIVEELNYYKCIFFVNRRQKKCNVENNNSTKGNPPGRLVKECVDLESIKTMNHHRPVDDFEEKKESSLLTLTRDSLDVLIQDVGENVRSLKAARAPKETIVNAVNILKNLKSMKTKNHHDHVDDFEEKKESSFMRFDDQVDPLDNAPKSINSLIWDSLDVLIQDAGENVRSLKAVRAPKETVVNAVNILKKIKEIRTMQ